MDVDHKTILFHPTSLYELRGVYHFTLTRVAVLCTAKQKSPPGEIFAKWWTWGESDPRPGNANAV